MWNLIRCIQGERNLTETKTKRKQKLVMKTNLSETMRQALELAATHNNKLSRYPGGFWKASPDATAWFGRQTIDALISRGLAQVSEVRLQVSGGKFAVEITLTEAGVAAWRADAQPTAITQTQPASAAGAAKDNNHADELVASINKYVEAEIKGAINRKLAVRFCKAFIKGVMAEMQKEVA